MNAQHDSALRSGLTFAGFSAGFAMAWLTWTHLPAAWHATLPAAAFISMATVTASLAWATSHTGWPWQAAVLLAAAGIATGAGFGTLVQRTAGGVAREHAASASGVLATTNQLAIVAGIAAGGTLYLSPGALLIPVMSLVLIAIATAQADIGTTVSIVLARIPYRQHDERPQKRDRAASSRLLSKPDLDAARLWIEPGAAGSPTPSPRGAGPGPGVSCRP